MDAKSRRLLETVFDPVRFKILEALRKNGAMPPIVIAQEVSISQQRLNYHLTVLRKSGAIIRGKLSHNLTYYVCDEPAIRKALQAASEHFKESTDG